jgi:hypothetical protein
VTAALRPQSAPAGTRTDAQPPSFITPSSLLAGLPRPRAPLPLLSSQPPDELSDPFVPPVTSDPFAPPVTSDPFAPPVMSGAPSELLCRELSAAFRAVEFEETTTVRSSTVMSLLNEAIVKGQPRSSTAAPGPEDATNKRLRPVPRPAVPGTARRVRRSRRAVFSNHLQLGCLVCLLATSLDDRGTTEASPASAAGSAAMTCSAAAAPALLPPAAIPDPTDGSACGAPHLDSSPGS